MVYSAEKGHLYCQHCESVEEIERNYDVKERDFSEMESVATWQDSSVYAYRCQNCGAQTILSQEAKRVNSRKSLQKWISKTSTTQRRIIRI